MYSLVSKTRNDRTGNGVTVQQEKRVTGIFFPCLSDFLLMLWLMFINDNKKKDLKKCNKRYIKTWRALVLVLRENVYEKYRSIPQGGTP